VSAWGELVSAGLLGTERREPDAPALVAVERASAEERLLAGAATSVVYRRAGALPRAAPERLAPAAAETLPRCSDAAALRLAVILGGDFLGVLDEWLELARRRGVRVPEELLPVLLDHARGERRARVLAVAGERGRWLAGLDESWGWAAAGEDAWRTGSLDARRAWLREQRQRDPAAGRAALEEAWAEEEPRARGPLLAELRAGLGPDDEDFLEAALDDRRQEVRAVASDLLARLPGSALRTRMTERARPLLRVTRGLLSRLEAQLPEALDAAAARDLVSTRPPRGTGERAWWLRGIVAATPLELWETELGETPAALVAMPVRDNLRELLHDGWALAAARQESTAWAEVLLPATWAPQLVEVLSPETVERALLSAPRDGRAEPAMAALRRPFGLELSRELVRKRVLDRDLALALDPRVLEELPDDAPPSVARLLAFRADLRQELA
jgi:hypothetical protein